MFVGAKAFSNDAVNATKVVVKAGKSKIHALRLLNTTGAAAYLQIFDKLTADVTVGTTAPDWFVRLAANQDLVLPLTMPVDVLNGIVLAGCTSATNNTNAAISVTLVYE